MHLSLTSSKWEFFLHIVMNNLVPLHSYTALWCDSFNMVSLLNVSSVAHFKPKTIIIWSCLLGNKTVWSLLDTLSACIPMSVCHWHGWTQCKRHGQSFFDMSVIPISSWVKSRQSHVDFIMFPSVPDISEDALFVHSCKSSIFTPKVKYYIYW